MKYFTKEWYNDCQKHSLHYSLKVSSEAEQFSEGYFKCIYEKRLEEYAENYKELMNIDKQLCPDTQFNPDNPQKQAIERYSRDMKRLLEMLPLEILNSIADIRVLTLGIVSSENYEKIKYFCEETDRRIESISDSYWNYFATIKHSLRKELIVLNRQHDEHIRKIGFANWDYIIETAYCSFIFKNAKILEDVERLGNLVWLYNEIYLLENQYEVHILFSTSRSNAASDGILLTQVTIQSDEILIFNPVLHTEYLQ